MVSFTTDDANSIVAVFQWKSPGEAVARCVIMGIHCVGHQHGESMELQLAASVSC